MNKYKSRSLKYDLSKINVATSLVVLIISLCIILGSFLGEMDFETSIRIVLGLIVGFFVFNAVMIHTERHELIEKTNDNFKNLIDHVGVMKIIKSPDEYYRNLKSSIDSAKDSVRLLYLTKSSPTTIGSYSQNYWDWFQDYVGKKSNGVVIRRIASLDSKEKIDWLVDKTIELAEIPNYGVRVFDPLNCLPLMGLEIIDNKEVFLFGPHGKTPRWIFINNPDVAEGMTQYFEELWSRLSDNEIKSLGAVVTEDSIRKIIDNCLSKSVDE